MIYKHWPRHPIACYYLWKAAIIINCKDKNTVNAAPVSPTIGRAVCQKTKMRDDQSNTIRVRPILKVLKTFCCCLMVQMHVVNCINSRHQFRRPSYMPLRYVTSLHIFFNFSFSVSVFSFYRQRLRKRFNNFAAGRQNPHIFKILFSEVEKNILNQGPCIFKNRKWAINGFPGSLLHMNINGLKCYICKALKQQQQPSCDALSCSSSYGDLHSSEL